MKTIRAENVENHLGEILSMAEADPIAIQERNGHTVVLLSKRRYEILEQLENIYWAELAEEAFAKNNWTGPEESEIALQEMLNAKD